MAQNLAEHFVFHRHIGFASNRIAELGFEHAERAFDIRAIVIKLQKLFSFELEVVKHLRHIEPLRSLFAVAFFRNGMSGVAPAASISSRLLLLE